MNAPSLNETTLWEVLSTWPGEIAESLLAIRTSTRKMAEAHGIERARENNTTDVYLYGINDNDAADDLPPNN